MADLFDAQGEHDRLVKEAYGDGTLNIRQQGDRYLALLQQAKQARREWAFVEYDAVLTKGSQARFKHHLRRTGLVKAKARKGKIEVDIATIIAVPEPDGWHHKPMADLTPAQFVGRFDTRVKARDMATARLEPWRRIKQIVDQHPQAATVGEALTLAGTTLVEVLERAA